jgi:hypothetical protein
VNLRDRIVVAATGFLDVDAVDFAFRSKVFLPHIDAATAINADFDDG